MLYPPVPRLSSYQQRCALPSHIIDTQLGSTPCLQHPRTPSLAPYPQPLQLQRPRCCSSTCGYPNATCPALQAAAAQLEGTHRPEPCAVGSNPTAPAPGCDRRSRVHRHRRRRCQRPACCLSVPLLRLAPEQPVALLSQSIATQTRSMLLPTAWPVYCSPTSPAHESQPAPVRAPSPSMTAARTLSQPHPLLAQAHPVQLLGPGAQPSRPRTHINQDPTSCACNPSPPAHRTHSSHLLPGLFPPLPRC